jgi:hypothetical protein
MLCLLLLLGPSKQMLSLPNTDSCCGGKDTFGHPSLCSMMVGWVLLSGRPGLAHAGQEKLMLLSLHHTRYCTGIYCWFYTDGTEICSAEVTQILRLY